MEDLKLDEVKIISPGREGFPLAKGLRAIGLGKLVEEMGQAGTSNRPWNPGRGRAGTPVLPWPSGAEEANRVLNPVGIQVGPYS